MGKNLIQKIIEKHLVHGEIKKGSEIAIKIDQTLTQDATGTMAYLQFEAIGIQKVKTELSVSYVDHNTLQTGFENADDHRFLRTFASKYGIYFSAPGNGICHQVHLERFGIPGKTLLGSDSHTPTAGGIGMLAIGVGGLEIATAMAGYPFYINMPEIVLVKLRGKLRPYVSAKDIILELLRRLTVKGGVGKIFEYGGEALKELSVPERATITNMGAELGATTSIFPSDEVTCEFLKAEGREKDFIRLTADNDAQYDEVIDIDLDSLEPLIACPHSPDNVVKVKELKDISVDQVCIGSCTNSSYKDLVTVAKLLKGKKLPQYVSLVISPGSKQVMETISKEGYLNDIISSGARILENACGPCIGMGQSPASGAVSLRTYNRNFEGRSGTKDAKVYLCSPEVAVASALAGRITDPTTFFKEAIVINLPEKFVINDNLIFPPSENPEKVEIIRGPNIAPLPVAKPLEERLEASVLIKVGDNITTDHIMPAGAKILPLRSNIPAISRYVFYSVDENFYERAKKAGSGFIIGGENYGQGSSREHAALAPMYLGIKAVIAKSFARIHRSNLINFGILPLVFVNPDVFGSIDNGDILVISNYFDSLSKNEEIRIYNKSKDFDFYVKANLTSRQVEIIKSGGLLNFVKRSD
ncbi:MAG: aconitate hydratase [Proteobacteria bacterium]|nr:aconitate hydratase [Pseudomonadota bacterium]